MKKKRGLLAMTGILLLTILIGVYIFVKGMNKEETDTEEEETQAQEEITTGNSEDVKSIRFQLDGKEVVWNKSEDQWTLDGQKDFPADADKINTLVSSVSSIPVSRKLENIKNLKDYGLEEPVNVIEIIKNDDSKETVYVGNKNPSTGDTYIYINEEASTVYTVAQDLAAKFSGDLYDFAQGEEYPAIMSGNITGVEVKKDENSYTLESNTESSTSWYITDEKGDRKKADAAKAETLQSTAAGLSYSGYYAYECEDWSAYGLDDPAMILTIHYTEQEETDTEKEEENTEDTEEEPKMVNKTLTIKVGDSADDGNYYVRLGDSKEVHGMSQSSIDSIKNGKAFDYWNMDVESINIADLDHLDVTYDGKQYTLKRIVTEEKSEEEDSEEDKEEAKEVTRYYVNDEEEDSAEFMDFYRGCQNMVCQNRLEEVSSLEEAELTLHYMGTDGRELTVMYAPRDASFYTMADTDGNYGLVNKMNVKELIDQFAVLISTEK